MWNAHLEPPPPKFWFTEKLTEFDQYRYGASRILAHKRTRFQELYIVDGGPSGKSLILDHKRQLCTADEFIYHETLVHPPLVLHECPRSVLVLGGGDGGAVREVLRWRTVEEVTLVDVDDEVVRLCQEHLPEVHQGALNDRRVLVVFDDAFKFVSREGGNTWDAIVADLTDPEPSGPAGRLFTKEFYQMCRGLLSEQGCLVVQAGEVSPGALTHHARLARTLLQVFPVVASYVAPVPSFGTPCGMLLASMRARTAWPDSCRVERILSQAEVGELRFIDGRMLLSLMETPRYVRAAILSEMRPYGLLDRPLQ